MLAIGIDLHKRPIALASGVKESCSHRATDPNIEREGDNCGTSLSGPLCSVVDRAVIHNQDICLRLVLTDFRDDITDGALLVPRRYRYQRS